MTAFIEATAEDPARLAAVIDDLDARGLGEFVCIDPGIVRGLAYYTGVVFEIFDSGSRCARSPAAGATTAW